MAALPDITMATRFRGYLPVVIDVETGGFNHQTDALLEIAAVLVEMRADGSLTRGSTFRHHVVPFPGANMEPASLAVNGIDPWHPLRLAVPEAEALQNIFKDNTKSEVAQFKGEPSRSDLTQPPPGYQTPSAAQPYGLTPRQEKAKPFDLTRRGESN